MGRPSKCPLPVIADIISPSIRKLKKGNIQPLFFPFAILLISCSNDKRDLKQLEEDFIKKATRFHELYITAGDCDDRNDMIDRDILFFENGQTFTYQNILDYCSYIEPKNTLDIYSRQYLIQPSVGFDYVEQYYLNSEQDTIRETSSRIWQFKSGTWLVTHMQVSRHSK